MKRTCNYCGAVLEEGSKICTNCGKVIATQKKVNNQGGQFNNFDERATQNVKSTKNVQNTQQKASGETFQRTQQKANRQGRGSSYEDFSSGTSVKRQAARKNYDFDTVSKAQNVRIPFETNASSGKENRSKIAPVLSTIVKIILILVIAYIVFMFVRCYLVSHKSYNFDLDDNIKLTSENYGEAVDNYFKDGKWRYDIKENKVTYIGETNSGEEYVMTFGSRDGETVVISLTIDGERVPTDKIMDLYVMPMFMADNKK